MADRNVLSWHQALEKGFNPSDYPFQTESPMFTKLTQPEG